MLDEIAELWKNISSRKCRISNLYFKRWKPGCFRFRAVPRFIKIKYFKKKAEIPSNGLPLDVLKSFIVP